MLMITSLFLFDGFKGGPTGMTSLMVPAALSIEADFRPLVLGATTTPDRGDGGVVAAGRRCGLPVGRATGARDCRRMVPRTRQNAQTSVPRE